MKPHYLLCHPSKVICTVYVLWGIDFASFYDCAIGFWNCSDCSIFCFIHSNHLVRMQIVEHLLWYGVLYYTLVWSIVSVFQNEDIQFLYLDVINIFSAYMLGIYIAINIYI